MVQRGECLGPALEAGNPVGISSERLPLDLDRDITIQLRIPRPVDLPHAAHADLGGDFYRDQSGRLGSAPSEAERVHGVISHGRSHGRKGRRLARSGSSCRWSSSSIRTFSRSGSLACC